MSDNPRIRALRKQGKLRKKKVKPRVDAAVKEAVLVRDRYRCRICGSENRITIHHLKRRAEFPELASDPDNLATLCQACHGEVEHGKADMQMTGNFIPEDYRDILDG